MYKSPIEVVVSQFQEMIIQQQDEQTLQAIQKVGIKVDKGELVKALAYDRGQYEKGYTDGIVAFAERLKGEMLSKYCMYFNVELTNAIIDLVLKEFVGDNNGKV